MEVRRHVNDLRNRIIDGVYDALARALAAHRRLQERCIRALDCAHPRSGSAIIVA